MQLKHMLLVLLILLFSGLRAEAATTPSSFTVKAAGGGNFTTIAACSVVALAGDSCVVFAGTYSGWTPTSSGIAGLPITYQVNPGDTVTITSSIAASGKSYITIRGFKFSSGAGISGNSSTQHWVIDSNSFSGNNIFHIPDGAGSTGSDNVFSNNTVVNGSGSGAAIYVFGDRNRFENNNVGGGGGSDCFELGGTNVVVRGNNCHDENGSTSGEHIDFVQVIGGSNPTLSFSLIEGNIIKNNVNQAHGLQIRASGGQVADTIIFRYNYAYSLSSDFAAYGNHLDGATTVPNGFVYNNTAAVLGDGSAGAACGFDAGFGTCLNNIFYSSEPNGTSPVAFYTGGGFSNGNLAFNPGYSGSWGSPYSTEATYGALHNQDPKFANYPTDGTLQAGSPAIGAGVALTTASGSGASSTSLTVANAHGFQPGWAGAQADVIRIGASTTVQISSINYSTNVITLANPVSWNNGASVYLYKKSDGVIVLNGAAPDIGAYPSQSGAQVPPVAPSNLQAVVN